MDFMFKIINFSLYLMKNCNVVELTLNKSNDYSVYFVENNHLRKLIGEEVKFIDFTLKNSNEFNSSENSEQNTMQINNFFIFLSLPRRKDERDQDLKKICKISLNLKENISQMKTIDHSFMSIHQESFIKIELCDYDEDNYTPHLEKGKQISTFEKEYVLKITYEYSKNPIDKCNNNLKNFLTNNINHSPLDLYCEEEDEEDEDYDEEESDLNDESSEESEIIENKDLAVSNNKEIDDELDLIQELFHEADDINEDLRYLTDEEIESESYISLIEANINNGPKNINNISNKGNKRYMLRRKRGPTYN